MRFKRKRLARNMFVIGNYIVEKDEGNGTWCVGRQNSDHTAPTRDFDTYQDARNYAVAMSTLGQLGDKYGFLVQRSVHI